MRIIHFVDTYHSLTETFVNGFVKKSSEIAEVLVVCFHKNNIFEDNNKIKIIKLRGENKSLRSNSGRITYIYERILNRPIWYEHFRKLLLEFNPNIIHCHFGTVGVLVCQFSNYYKLNFPVVVSFYGFDIAQQSNIDINYKLGLVKLFNSSFHYFAEGQVLVEKLIEIGAKNQKIHELKLIVDFEKYKLRDENKLNNLKIDFLLIGSFKEKKGFHIFFEALGKSKHLLKDFSITVIGNGELKNKYIDIIEKYDYIDKVEFLGYKKLDYCIEKMCQNDVLIHPSLNAIDGDSEGGAPTILIEAQYVGIPIISTLHCDIPNVMGYNDFLAKENDVEDLIRVLLNYNRKNNFKFIINKGRHFVMENHSITNDKYFYLLQMIIDQQTHNKK